MTVNTEENETRRNSDVQRYLLALPQFHALGLNSRCLINKKKTAQIEIVKCLRASDLCRQGPQGSLASYPGLVGGVFLLAGRFHRLIHMIVHINIDPISWPMNERNGRVQA